MASADDDEHRARAFTIARVRFRARLADGSSGVRFGWAAKVINRDVEHKAAEYMHTVHVLREAKAARSDFAVLAGMEEQILPALPAPPEAEGAVEAGLEEAGQHPVRRGA